MTGLASTFPYKDLPAVSPCFTGEKNKNTNLCRNDLVILLLLGPGYSTIAQSHKAVCVILSREAVDSGKAKSVILLH